MVYGAISSKDERYYTDLQKLFDAIENVQLEYNWLITALECNQPNQIEDEYLKQGYCWISGKELTRIVKETPFQWIWAVLSGFQKDIALEDVLAYPSPEVDEYTGFWSNPLSIQHPLATIEIVPWDSSLVLFLSRQKELVDKFREANNIDDPIFVFQTQCIQLTVQFLKTLLDDFIIQAVIVTVMTKEHFQNRLGITVPKVRRVGSNIASQRLNIFLHRQHLQKSLCDVTLEYWKLQVFISSA